MNYELLNPSLCHAKSLQIQVFFIKLRIIGPVFLISRHVNWIWESQSILLSWIRTDENLILKKLAIILRLSRISNVRCLKSTRSCAIKIKRVKSQPWISAIQCTWVFGGKSLTFLNWHYLLLRLEQFDTCIPQDAQNNGISHFPTFNFSFYHLFILTNWTKLINPIFPIFWGPRPNANPSSSSSPFKAGVWQSLHLW